MSFKNSVSQCVILLGGLGTRLGELTRDTPKPLLAVGDRPFVDILIREAVRRGFTKVLLLAGFRSDVVADYISKTREWLPSGCEIAISVEPEPLGTGGALGLARDLLDEQFLLLNGDTWFDFNWLDLVQCAGNCAAVAARRVDSADRYESLAIDPAGKVHALVDRGSGPSPAFINGGVYVLRRNDLEGFSGKFSIEADVLPSLIAAGRLRARVYDSFFIDIGIPETYAAAQTDVVRQLSRPALFLDRDGVINHDDNYVGSFDRIRWIDGVAPAIRLANNLGYYVFVVTNQAGVARGFYGEDDVKALHAQMTGALREMGATIDDWRYCPFHPEAAIARYRQIHPWRKPQPGMLLDLMRAWPIDKARSLLVGDQPSDEAAAQAAGITAHRFGGGDLYTFLSTVMLQRIPNPSPEE